MIVALDATCLVYLADPGGCRPQEAEAAAQADEYVDLVRRRMDDVIIPAPAFAEALAYYPADLTTQVTQIINRGMLVVPTDMRAAAEAADIWRQVGGRAFLRRLSGEFDISKQCVKTDILIVATARTHGAAEIVAVDRGVKVVCEQIGMPCLTPAECLDRARAADRPRSPGLFD